MKDTNRRQDDFEKFFIILTQCHLDLLHSIKLSTYFNNDLENLGRLSVSSIKQESLAQQKEFLEKTQIPTLLHHHMIEVG